MTYIPLRLRRQVIQRANGCCEYCRVKQGDRAIDFAIDHIIAEKHGGATDADNLCLSCYTCNSYKGSDIVSADPETGVATFLFHPRRQKWNEHFQINDVFIDPISAEGRVTVFLLRLNSSERLAERELLIHLGEYPC